MKKAFSLVLLVVVLFASCSVKAEVIARDASDPQKEYIEFPYAMIQGLDIGKTIRFNMNHQQFYVVKVKNGYIINSFNGGGSFSSSSTIFVSLNDF